MSVRKLEAQTAILTGKGVVTGRIANGSVTSFVDDVARKVVAKRHDPQESMMESLNPNRAEVNDVANSVMDGADAVMLSGETSVGKHPIEVIQTISSIIGKVENSN